MTLNSEDDFIIPDWPCPANIRAVSTTRCGGVSQKPFDSFNLAMHVGDDPEVVAENRKRLKQRLKLQQEPAWLEQVHGIDVVESPRDLCVADASFSREFYFPCVVMTADCLPVLMTNCQGTAVAAAHAGWRGMLNGVIEQTLAQFADERSELMVWLGPAIGSGAFEVGDEVRDAYVSDLTESVMAFIPGDKGKWFADIYQLARLRLERAGVTAIYGGEFCTYSDAERFFSYRRESQTGRMASLIWIE